MSISPSQPNFFISPQQEFNRWAQEEAIESAIVDEFIVLQPEPTPPPRLGIMQRVHRSMMNLRDYGASFSPSRTQLTSSGSMLNLRSWSSWIGGMFTRSPTNLSSGSIAELGSEAANANAAAYPRYEERFLSTFAQGVERARDIAILDKERLALQGTIHADWGNLTNEQRIGQLVVEQFRLDLIRGTAFTIGNEGNQHVLSVPNYSKWHQRLPSYTLENHLRRALGAITLAVGQSQNPEHDLKWTRLIQAVCTQSPKNAALYYLKGEALQASATLKYELDDEDPNTNYMSMVVESASPINVCIQRVNGIIEALFVNCSIPLALYKVSDTDTNDRYRLQDTPVDLTVQLSFTVKIDEAGQVLVCDYRKRYSGDRFLG